MKIYAPMSTRVVQFVVFCSSERKTTVETIWSSAEQVCEWRAQKDLKNVITSFKHRLEKRRELAGSAKDRFAGELHVLLSSLKNVWTEKEREWVWCDEKWVWENDKKILRRTVQQNMAHAMARGHDSNSQFAQFLRGLLEREFWIRRLIVLGNGFDGLSVVTAHNSSPMAKGQLVRNCPTYLKMWAFLLNYSFKKLRYLKSTKCFQIS